MTGRTWVVELPAGTRTLSLNKNIHWGSRERITADLREKAGWLAKAAKIPHLNQVRIIVEYQPPPLKRGRDNDNIPAATGKPCIDGLVDAGVLTDDCPPNVTEIVVRIGDPFPRGRIVLHVIEICPPQNLTTEQVTQTRTDQKTG